MTRCGIEPSHPSPGGHSRPKMGVGSYARGGGQHGAGASRSDPGDIVNVGHVVDVRDMHTAIDSVERRRLKSGVMEVIPMTEKEVVVMGMEEERAQERRGHGKERPKEEPRVPENRSMEADRGE